MPQSQDDEFIEIQSETGTAFQRFMVRHMTLVKQVSTVWAKGLNDSLKCEAFTFLWVQNYSFCLADDKSIEGNKNIGC